MIAAFNIDSSEIEFVAANTNGEFLTKVYSKGTRSEELKKQIEKCRKKLEEETQRKIKTVCIATTGRVDSSKRLIEHFDTAKHDEIENIDLSGIEGEVLVENDCNATALGGHIFGEASEYRCSIHITIDEGIGSGIVYDGEIFYGENGQAGEVGLIPIRIGESHHSYGVEGAWEAFASSRGLREFLSKNTSLEVNDHSYKRLQEMSEGDSEASEVLDIIDRVNAAGIAAVINSFNPGYISIGGKMALDSSNLIDRLDKLIEKNSFVEKPEIKFINKKERARLYGAISLKKREET